MSTCGEVGSDVHVLIKELAIRRVEHRSETHSNELKHPVEGTEVARLRRRFSFVLQQALSFRTRHHLCRQGVALASTRQLRFQSPASVHAHRTKGIIESEEREEANVVGGGIGVGGGNGDGNRVRGGNEDLNGGEDGTGEGMGTATGVEVNERAKDGNGDGNRDGTGTGTGTGREREQEHGWRIGDDHRMGTGTRAGNEIRAVSKMRTEARVGTVTGTRAGLRREQER